ncbi:hypothetical protein AHAS_Ahas19G0230000 [Arachis hypogaea]
MVLDDDDDDYDPDESHPSSASGTSEQRKLEVKHENFLRKSRDRVAVLMKFIDNIHEDDTMATDQEEPVDSEEDGSDA